MWKRFKLTLLAILMLIATLIGVYEYKILPNYQTKNYNLAALDYYKHLWFGFGYEAIDAISLNDKMQAGSQILVLDIRKPDLFAAGHIEQAYSLPFNSFIELEWIDMVPESEPELVVVSQSGRDSRVAASILSKQGFGKVYHLDGGIDDWGYRLFQKESKPAVLKSQN